MYLNIITGTMYFPNPVETQLIWLSEFQSFIDSLTSQNLINLYFIPDLCPLLSLHALSHRLNL